MKETKFTDTQIVLVLKQGQDDASAARCARKAGIAEATFRNWHKY